MNDTYEATTYIIEDQRPRQSVKWNEIGERGELGEAIQLVGQRMSKSTPKPVEFVTVERVEVEKARKGFVVVDHDIVWREEDQPRNKYRVRKLVSRREYKSRYKKFGARWVVSDEICMTV